MATVVGTRPNFIKIALLYKRMLEAFNCVLVHTGQHYDFEMSDMFFKELNIPRPDYNLGIGSGTHAEQVGKAMVEIEKILIKEKPDRLLVVGDVNSSLAGALAACKLKIPIAHVEAGIRCRDMSQPEEINRVLIDRVSDLNLCPTRSAVVNLHREGIIGVFTGDIMLDNFLHYCKFVKPHGGEYFYCTVHRERNTDVEANLLKVLSTLRSIKERVIFAIHPRTTKYIRERGLSGLLDSPNLDVSPPVSYAVSLSLVMGAKAVLTDSGGLQKEAYFAGVPCFTLDSHTAWLETTWEGANILVGNLSEEDILIELSKKRSFHPELGLFGDGKAAENIMDVLGA
jgi:UDP-N-acetylglucosamine 2-epimerase